MKNAGYNKTMLVYSLVLGLIFTIGTTVSAMENMRASSIVFAELAPDSEAERLMLAKSWDTESLRMAAINSRAELFFNRGVAYYVKQFLSSSHISTKIFSKSHYYFPKFEMTFRRAGVPTELMALAIVESHLDNEVTSPVGAAGMWQIMPATARNLGLTVDESIDERRDPYLAASAAADYLADSFDQFDSWVLAIASYNCGPGNVRKAIRKAGGSTDYQKVRPFLPQQTKAYVAKIMAAIYLMQYDEMYGLVDEYQPDCIHGFDLIVTDRLDLRSLASEYEVSVSDIKALNPAFRQNSYNLKEAVSVKMPARVSNLN
ncbi:lytic transglycosylase domain-containing protein [Chitinophagales bacterium]|nr:lytic transglycosylase domain-containing protein [Chitinophagales bacterium]